MISVPTEWHHLLSEFCQAWRTHDQDRLTALWDDSYPDLIYIAEERRHPIIGWESICSYYRETLALMEWMNVKIKPIRCSALGEVMWLIGKGTWAGQNRTRSSISGGFSTVCFLARKREDRLRLIQYIEAPLNARYARPARYKATDPSS